MPDSTTNGPATGLARDFEIVDEHFPSIQTSPVFHEALNLFEQIALDLRKIPRRDAPQHAVAGILNRSAWELVAAAANCHAAHAVFKIVAALDAAHRPAGDCVAEPGRA